MKHAEQAIASVFGATAAIGIYLGLGFAADQVPTPRETYENEITTITKCSKVLGKNAVWTSTFPEECDPLIPQITYQRRTSVEVIGGRESETTEYKLPPQDVVAALRPDLNKIEDDYDYLEWRETYVQPGLALLSGVGLAGFLLKTTEIPRKTLRFSQKLLTRAKPRQ